MKWIVFDKPIWGVNQKIIAQKSQSIFFGVDDLSELAEFFFQFSVKQKRYQSKRAPNLVKLWHVAQLNDC